MIERSPKGKERNIAKDAGLALATLVALGGLANLAVSSGKRKDIKERAGGKCESCGASVSDAEAIIGHMDHSARKDGRYRSGSNLRMHCLGCEAEFHLSHIGSEKNIGLNKKDNDSTVIARLLQLLRIKPEKFIELMGEYAYLMSDDLFLRIYFNEPELIEDVYVEAQEELPINLYKSISIFSSDDEYSFVFLYFRKKEIMDALFQSRDWDFPVDLVEFFERAIVESIEDFIRLYLGYELQIKDIFNDAGKTMPDLKMILEELVKEDNNELKRLVEMFPDLFNIISPDLIQ